MQRCACTTHRSRTLRCRVQYDFAKRSRVMDPRNLDSDMVLRYVQLNETTWPESRHFAIGTDGYRCSMKDVNYFAFAGCVAGATRVGWGMKVADTRDRTRPHPPNQFTGLPGPLAQPARMNPSAWLAVTRPRRPRPNSHVNPPGRAPNFEIRDAPFFQIPAPGRRIYMRVVYMPGG